MKKGKNKPISSKAIMSVAKDMFCEKGYRGTTIQDIANKLKVSKPAIYYYFNNKMEILETLCSGPFEELIISFKEIIDSDLPLNEKFRVLIKNHVQSIAENTKIVKLFFQEEKELPKNLISVLRRKKKSYVEQLIKFYKDGVFKGPFRDFNSVVAVYTILGACNWIYMWYSPGGTIKKDEIGELVSNILCEGYFSDNQKLLMK
jgi:AcrR family transcriptional regulator